MEKLEQERKFLVEIPLRWYGKFKVLTADKKRIHQSYLKEEDVDNSRVRSSFTYAAGTTTVEYTYTKKEFISPGVNKEFEIKIPQSIYLEKIKILDYSRKRIEKVRYYLHFNKMVFELDVFEGRLLGLAILEIEMNDINDEVILPPYLKIIKEITDDRNYSNRELAKITNGLEKITFPRRID